jgi:hypothetical protein
MKILRRLRELRRRNSANLHRNFGKRCALIGCSPSRVKAERVAVKWWLRLFNKNTALCKHESGRIGCDACPVPEG